MENNIVILTVRILAVSFLLSLINRCADSNQKGIIMENQMAMAWAGQYTMPEQPE